MSKILIKNGKVWDGERFCFADVLTENEKISKIADNIDEAAEFEYDASGKIVSAGLVDIHVYMKEIHIHSILSNGLYILVYFFNHSNMLLLSATLLLP